MPLTPSPEPVWIVGPVTWDEVRDERVAGGTASYIARACESVGAGAFACVLAGDDADLGALEGHEVHIARSETLTLRQEFPERRRVQTLVQPAGRTLTPEDAPEGWPEPATLILAPLMAEDIDVGAFVDAYPAAEVAIVAQGLQRAVVPGGQIANRAQPSSALLDAARPNVSIFLSDHEVMLWPAGTVEHVAARCARVVVTRGADGATIHDRHGSRTVDPVPVEPVDTTGAGDVFAAAFILALRAGEEFAGRLAAGYAAAAVEVHGPRPLPSPSEIERRFGIGQPSSPLERGSAAGGTSA